MVADHHPNGAEITLMRRGAVAMGIVESNITPLRGEDVPMDDDALIAQAIQRKVACPQLYLRLLGGDAKAAIFLAQVEYWQGITKNSDGWFYHTEKEWRDELGYSLYEVKRCVDVLTRFGMKFKKEKVNGAPCMHFKVEHETLKKEILKKLKNPATTSENEELDNQETSESNMQKLQNPSSTNCRIIKTKSTPKSNDIDTTDANASGDAACADAPSPALVSPLSIDTTMAAPGTANSITPPRTSSKRRSPAAPAARASPKEKASPEQQQYRDACWALLRGPGKRDSLTLGKSQDGKEVMAMDWLYRNKVPGQKVKEQFMVMLLDPKYRTKSISLTHLVDEYPGFKSDPVAFSAEYERRAANGARKPANGYAQSRNSTRTANIVTQADAETEHERLERLADEQLRKLSRKA